MVYGEDSLARGSGLYVGENGVVCDHHFLLPDDGTKFDFLRGEYKLEVYASLVKNQDLGEGCYTRWTIIDGVIPFLGRTACSSKAAPLALMDERPLRRQHRTG
jgi:hypothetical protein